MQNRQQIPVSVLHQGSGGSPSGGAGREERGDVRMREVPERLSYVFGRGKDGLRFHFSFFSAIISLKE